MSKINTSLISAKSAPNTALIKQALLARQANRRQSTAQSKTRGNVSGGGAKPWRQKGTGRARAGSRRSPIWVGGGITFGPTKERNFKTVLPKKMNKQAMLELLNHLKNEKMLVTADKISLKEAKTKAALKLLSEHGLTGQKVLIVTEKIEPELVLGTRNVAGVKTTIADHLSILDLSAGKVLMETAVAKKMGLVKESIKSSQKETK